MRVILVIAAVVLFLIAACAAVWHSATGPLSVDPVAFIGFGGAALSASFLPFREWASRRRA
jgi:hypothetical protein